MTPSKKQLSKVTEIAFYRYFPLSYYFGLIVVWIMMFWITQKEASIQECIRSGFICGFIYHLPMFVSTFIMNWIKKPILRFDEQGFYYTPHIWSESRLYEWDTITAIEINRYEFSDGEGGNSVRYVMTISFSNGDRISVNEKIIPISYNELLKIFQYRLKNVPVKVLE